MRTIGHQKNILLVLWVMWPLTIVSYGADCGGLVQCACGDTLVASQVMWYDIVDCAAAWTLRIGADDLTLDGDGHTIDGDTQFNLIQMGAKSGVTIQNCIIQDGQYGIFMDWYCNDNTISSNQFYNNEKAIVLNRVCTNTIISDNLIDNNLHGIRFDWLSNNNTCSGNTITNCNYGIYHYNSQANTFYDNIFIDNTFYNAFEDSVSNGNFWNFGTVGNYWDDMTSNPGYPSGYYEIGGPGDGIDWYPVSTDFDGDGDGFYDYEDNCPDDYNPSQADSDGDGLGNACDADCPNLDGINPVNYSDFLILASDWLESGEGLQADLDFDGHVDVNDLDIFSGYWLGDCYE